MAAAVIVGVNEMGLTKVSDIKPGDKVHIMGMDLFVSYIRCNGQMISIDFESENTINNPFLTDIIVKCHFNSDRFITVLDK